MRRPTIAASLAAITLAACVGVQLNEGGSQGGKQEIGTVSSSSVNSTATVPLFPPK